MVDHRGLAIQTHVAPGNKPKPETLPDSGPTGVSSPAPLFPGKNTLIMDGSPEGHYPLISNYYIFTMHPEPGPIPEPSGSSEGKVEITISAFSGLSGPNRMGEKAGTGDAQADHGDLRHRNQTD